HWTNRLVAHLRLIPLRLNCVIASSQEALALQRVYANQYSGATFRKQTSLFDISVTQQLTNFVDVAKVNLRKRRSFIWRSAVPKLGVTCPHFFRCEAPRLSQLAILPRQSIPQTDHFRRLPAAAEQTLNSLPIVMMKCEGYPVVPRAKYDADLFFFVEPRRREEIATFPEDQCVAQRQPF